MLGISMDTDKVLRAMYHADLAVMEGANKPLITYEEWYAKRPWIYESPDKGETVYRRKFGDKKREQI